MTALSSNFLEDWEGVKKYWEVKTGAVKNAILVFEYLKKLVLRKTHKIQLFKHASEADDLGLKKG